MATDGLTSFADFPSFGMFPPCITFATFIHGDTCPVPTLRPILNSTA